MSENDDHPVYRFSFADYYLCLYKMWIYLLFWIDNFIMNRFFAVTKETCKISNMLHSEMRRIFYEIIVPDQIIYGF